MKKVTVIQVDVCQFIWIFYVSFALSFLCLFFHNYKVSVTWLYTLV